jgi:hypothetical protein
LEERLLRMQEARGSNPLISTIIMKELQGVGNLRIDNPFILKGPELACVRIRVRFFLQARHHVSQLGVYHLQVFLGCGPTLVSQ